MKLKVYFIAFVLFACLLDVNITGASNVITRIHTDRNCYVSGDFVLVKLIFQYADDDRVIKDVTMYVDLADGQNQFITGEIFRLHNGEASGVFKLPDALKTGYYTIRVYNYESIKSHGQKVLDTKEVFITNRFSQEIEIQVGVDRIFDFNKDSIPIANSTNNSFLIALSDTVFEQRSKIEGSVHLAPNNENEVSWLSLSVKPVSSCECRMAEINNRKSILKEREESAESEKKQIKLKGLLTNTETDKPITNTLVLATFEDPLSEFKHSLTNEKGEFDLLFEDRYGRKKLNIKALTYPGLEPHPKSKITLVENSRGAALPLNPNASFAESNGLIISGNVTENNSGAPISNSLVFVAVEDTFLKVNYGITNSDGNFEFLLPDDCNEQKVYLSVHKYPDLTSCQSAKVTIDSKFLNAPMQINELKSTNIFEESDDTLNVLKSIISIAYEQRKLEKVEVEMTEESLFEHQYLSGNIQYSVNLDDYIALPNFSEILKEILPLIRIESKEGGSVFYFVDDNSKRKYPFVFVDGVPLSNTDVIMDWGSDKIKTIQLQHLPRYFGDVPFEDGIMFIWTRKMNFWSGEGVKNKPVRLPGFQQPVKLSFPDYSKQNNQRHPDFRQVLFWEPSVVVSKNKPFDFSFYTSDEAGEFELILQGINKNNKPIEVRKYFHVKNY